MKSEVDELIKEAKKEEKYFKNSKRYAKMIKKDEVAKDIDILIVSPKLKNSLEKSKVKAQIWKKLKFFSPFEIHLATPEEYKNWYSHFIEEKIEI